MIISGNAQKVEENPESFASDLNTERTVDDHQS